MDTKDITEALAKRLRGARSESQTTNKEAGKALKKSQRTIARIVADPGQARARDILDLLAVYGKDPQKVWNAAFNEARREARRLSRIEVAG